MASVAQDCDETIISEDCDNEIRAATVPAFTISYLFSSLTAKFDKHATTSRNISTSSDANKCASGANAPSWTIFILLLKVTDNPRNAAAAC